jgi:16S rRNA (guanine527-N7)-methyltransferase
MPRSEVVLLDSVRKKARFLETAVVAAGLADRITVVAERAEALAGAVAGGGASAFDLVTARGVASLAELVRLAFPLLRPHGRLIAWKRGDIATELATAERVVAAAAQRAGAESSRSASRIDVSKVSAPGLEGHVLVTVRRPRGIASDDRAAQPPRRREQPG